MIYTLTTNPNIDYYMNLRAPLMPGGINRSSHELLAPGGKGVNVSLVLRALGRESCVVGFLAGHTGKLMQSLMDEAGCACRWFWLPEGQTRINTKINTSPETAFNASGPALDPASVDALIAFLLTLRPEDVLVVSGNLQRSPDGTFARILRAAAQAGAVTAVDTSGSALREALPLRPLFIKPNAEELAELFGADAGDETQVAALARRAQDAGARNVLVSMGAGGTLLLAEDGRIYRARVTRARPVVSTVGAGDSVTAGFLAGLLDTGSYAQALTLGTACGSATAYSACLADAAAIRSVLPDIEISEL